MNEIEIIVLIILLLMGIPELCRKAGRPALIYIVYLIVGLLSGPMLTSEARTLLGSVGNFGFILLLFGIGLEIDLPKLSDLKQTIGRTTKWGLFQFPAGILLALVAGLSIEEAFLAAVALTACSVGLAHPALKHLPCLAPDESKQILFAMIILEVQAIIFLSAGSACLAYGFGWKLFFQLLGITSTIILVGYFANHMTRLLHFFVERTTRWKIHIIVLFVLAISAIGERLGLSSAKTAFFLGLFISRATHKGLAFEEHLAPLSNRLLIPVFLVALGASIPLSLAFSYTGILALFSAVFLVAYRRMVYSRLVPQSGHPLTFLVLCPNLTMVAVAMQILNIHGTSSAAVGWMAFVGLFVTLFAIAGLPKLRSH